MSKKLVILVAGFAVAITAAGQATAGQVPAGCSAYASVPLPAEAERAAAPMTFPTCASYRSYRGIGRPVNYAEARACAWQERLAQKAGLRQSMQEPTAWMVGGSLILADIYFNGAGVKRNLPLALRLACEFEEQTAMLALPEIAKPAHGPFEFCDYAATTLTMNFCGDYESQVVDDRRSRYYNSLKSSMPAEQQVAFAKLLAAQKAYVEAHASEVDQGGTIHGTRTLGSQGILNDLFHTEVIHFEGKRWPVLTGAQVAASDDLLRRQYDKTLEHLRTRPKQQSYEGEVTADHVSSVEETWKKYRDAWVAFARLRYAADVGAIRAEIVLDRYRLLKTIS